MWEQHVFPGQVQEPAGKRALEAAFPGLYYLQVRFRYCSCAPAPKNGPQARPYFSSRPPGPSSFFRRYLTAPGSCSPPDGSIRSSVGCLLRVRSTVFSLWPRSSHLEPASLGCSDRPIQSSAVSLRILSESVPDGSQN